MPSIASHNTKTIDRDARRQQGVRRAGLPARSGHFRRVLCLVSVLWLVLTMSGWLDSPGAAEFVLLNDSSFSNLNSTSAEAGGRPLMPHEVVDHGNTDPTGASSRLLGSPTARAQAREVALPEAVAPVESRMASPAGPVPELLAMPLPEPVSLPPADLPRGSGAAEFLPILPAAVQEPANANAIRGPHQGDTPMMRTWKMLGLETFLAALFAATPALASNTSGPPSDAEKLDEIQKQLNALRGALNDIKNNLAGLSGLEKKVDDVRNESNLGAQKVQNQIADLNRQISQLRLEVENLRPSTSGTSRIAASPPENNPSAGTGRVEMINTYTQPVSIVINNRRSYTLAPGERRLSDPIPAGAFTYEILGVTPAVTRTVAADKLFTLWVHPQP